MNIEYFQKPSSRHDVDKNENSFTIKQKSNSEADRANFQIIAKEAIAYNCSDYKVIPHENKETGLNEFDLVTFIKT
jgi:hypothetical protein